MSIFGSIVSKIFGKAKPAEPVPAEAVTPTVTTTYNGAIAPVAAAPLTDIDVAAVLDQLAGTSNQTLDWRRSIVDLMKLLEVDSSLDCRKQLASELKYAGDLNDSAPMNIWLHQQLMSALAANGGKLPADLLR